MIETTFKINVMAQPAPGFGLRSTEAPLQQRTHAAWRLKTAPGARHPPRCSRRVIAGQLALQSEVFASTGSIPVYLLKPCSRHTPRISATEWRSRQTLITSYLMTFCSVALLAWQQAVRSCQYYISTTP